MELETQIRKLEGGEVEDSYPSSLEDVTGCKVAIHLIKPISKGKVVNGFLDYVEEGLVKLSFKKGKRISSMLIPLRNIKGIVLSDDEEAEEDKDISYIG